MRVVIRATLIVMIAFCAGCASQPAPIMSAVAPGQARISITRTDHALPFTRAEIKINGALIELAPGQSYSGGVPPGPVTMTASGKMDVGQYVVKFNAVAGKTYAFEVSQRAERIAASAIGGVAGMMIESAASGDQSGAFKITEVAR